MRVDWWLLLQAIWSVTLILLTAGITRLLERKPRLTYYATHWSAYPLAGPPSTTLHTHGIVIKNVGSKSATEVRIPHAIRTETVYVSSQTADGVTRPVRYGDRDLPGGGFEIVLDRLVRSRRWPSRTCIPSPSTAFADRSRMLMESLLKFPRYPDRSIRGGRSVPSGCSL